MLAVIVQFIFKNDEVCYITFVIIIVVIGHLLVNQGDDVSYIHCLDSKIINNTHCIDHHIHMKRSETRKALFATDLFFIAATTTSMYLVLWPIAWLLACIDNYHFIAVFRDFH